MQHWLNLPEWLPSWAPLALLLPTLVWGLSFLFMPFSVFGVKSRLEVLEQRLDEIQNEIRHIALRMPSAVASNTDYDDVYPPRMAEPRVSDRLMSRPPIPPARHDLFNAPDPESRLDPMRDAPREPIREPPPRESLPREMLPREGLPRETLPRETLPRENLPRETLPREVLPREVIREAPREPPREPVLEDRPPPPPNARPARRAEPLNRPSGSPSAPRSEPRLDWRR